PVPLEREMKKLEGTWIVRFHQRDGTWIPAEELKDETLLIAGNRMTFRLNGKATLEITYEIDPTRKPRFLDTSVAGKTVHGIYEIDGDKLKICEAPPGKDRPTTFKADAGSGRFLTFYERVPAQDDAKLIQGRWRLIDMGGDDDKVKRLVLAQRAIWFQITSDSITSLTADERVTTRFSYKLYPDTDPKGIGLT